MASHDRCPIGDGLGNLALASNRSIHTLQRVCAILYNMGSSQGGMERVRERRTLQVKALKTISKGWLYIFAFCAVIAVICAPAFVFKAFGLESFAVAYVILLFVIAISGVIYGFAELARDYK